MTGLRFVTVVGALLLSLGEGGAHEEDLETTPTQTAKRVDCLEAMNAIRAEVGLPDFKAATGDDARLPVLDADPSGEGGSELKGTGTGSPDQSALETAKTNQAKFLKSFCTAIRDHTTLGEQNSDKGTYLYAPATANEQGSCSAAVQYWLQAKSSFTKPPPAYSAAEPVYTSNKNISFVGLFNAQDNASVDCAWITCNPQAQVEDDDEDDEEMHKAQAASQSPGNATSPAVNSEPASAKDSLTPASSEHARRLSDNTAIVYSLLCLATPQALGATKAPFTQEQWDNIKGAANSSTQPAVFAVLSLVAVAVAHSSL